MTDNDRDNHSLELARLRLERERLALRREQVMCRRQGILPWTITIALAIAILGIGGMAVAQAITFGAAQIRYIAETLTTAVADMRPAVATRPSRACYTGATCTLRSPGIRRGACRTATPTGGRPSHLGRTSGTRWVMPRRCCSRGTSRTLGTTRPPPFTRPLS